MSEFPRPAEGRGVIEVIPSVFWAPDPTDPAAYADGRRVGYQDFVLVGEDLSFGPSTASRAFNTVYVDLRRAARDNNIIGSYYGASDRPSWEYFLTWSNVDKERRSHILLATQALHDTLQAHIQQLRPSKAPTPKHFLLIESLLGLDAIREADTQFAAISTDETFEQIGHEQN